MGAVHLSHDIETVKSAHEINRNLYLPFYCALPDLSQSKPSQQNIPLLLVILD